MLSQIIYAFGLPKSKLQEVASHDFDLGVPFSGSTDWVESAHNRTGEVLEVVSSRLEPIALIFNLQLVITWSSNSRRNTSNLGLRNELAWDLVLAELACNILPLKATSPNVHFGSTSNRTN